MSEFEQEWLRGLPPDWIEKRADFLCNPHRITVNPKDHEDELVAHYSIPQVQETGGPLIEPASDIDSNKLLVNEPMLLVSKLNPRKKTVCIAEPHSEHTTLASSEFVAINSDQIDRRYAYYLWCREQVTDRLSAIVQSVTRSHQRVNPADILKLPWKWPPLNTQQRIAQFLDKKTAQIDGLIEKKRTLLNRLAEKRQALITRAVTKGLNPDAPMKPSGIAWLGDIPEHWEVLRLKFVTSELLSYGVNAAAEFDEPDWPRFVRITDVDELGRLRDRTFRSLPPEVAEGFLLQENDILLARSGATVGKSFIYQESWGVACYAGYLIRARIGEAHDARFFYWFLNSTPYWEWVGSTFIQSTIQNISAERYANLQIAHPLGKAEQQKINDFIESSCAAIDSQREKIRCSIERLDEYRAALITSTVTGQIEGLR